MADWGWGSRWCSCPWSRTATAGVGQMALSNHSTVEAKKQITPSSMAWIMKNLSLAQARGSTGARLALAGPAPGCRWIQAWPTHASAFSKCHALRAFSCGGALERQDRARCVRPLKATVPILSTCSPLAKAGHTAKPKTSRWARNVLCPRGAGDRAEGTPAEPQPSPSQGGRTSRGSWS